MKPCLLIHNNPSLFNTKQIVLHCKIMRVSKISLNKLSLRPIEASLTPKHRRDPSFSIRDRNMFVSSSLNPTNFRREKKHPSLQRIKLPRIRTISPKSARGLQKSPFYLKPGKEEDRSPTPSFKETPNNRSYASIHRSRIPKYHHTRQRKQYSTRLLLKNNWERQRGWGGTRAIGN